MLGLFFLGGDKKPPKKTNNPTRRGARANGSEPRKVRRRATTPRPPPQNESPADAKSAQAQRGREPPERSDGRRERDPEGTRARRTRNTGAPGVGWEKRRAGACPRGGEREEKRGRTSRPPPREDTWRADTRVGWVDMWAGWADTASERSERAPHTRTAHCERAQRVSTPLSHKKKDLLMGLFLGFFAIGSKN